MNIETWQEALGHDRPLLACGAVGEAMQAEIDELRAALKTAQEAVVNNCARVLERDAEIEGWKADQKENMQIQVDQHQVIAAQRKVLEQALEALNDITAEVSMKRFWREKDEKRFDEIADEAITEIQEQLKS